MTPEARAGVEQAFLAVLRARYPDYAWKLKDERSQLATAQQVGRRLASPEDARPRRNVRSLAR